MEPLDDEIGIYTDGPDSNLWDQIWAQTEGDLGIDIWYGMGAGPLALGEGIDMLDAQLREDLETGE